MSQLRAYSKIFWASAREDGANPKRLISSILQTVLRVFLVSAIYRVAYTVSGGTHPLTFVNAMWTIGLCYTFFINLGIRNIYIPVEYEVKSGDAETSLIKPIDWRMAKIVQLLGKSGFEFLVQLVVLPLVLLVLVGPPSLAHLTWLSALAFIPFFFMALITAGALFMMVGLAAFWLNDAKSVFRLVDKMALIFCGTFVPLALLPLWLQRIAQYSPFGIYAAPTRLFDPTVVPNIPSLFLWGAVWCVVMVGLCQLMWNRVARRIEVNGG